MSKKEGEWQNIPAKYVIAGLSALIILLAILVFFHIPRRNSTDDKNGKGKDNNKDDKDDNDDKKSPKLKSSKSKSKK